MKLFKIIAVVAVLLLGFHLDADAQAARQILKVGKELVKKTPKATRNIKKSATIKQNSSKNANRAKDVPVLIDCSRCNGSGKISYWNPQMQQLQRVDCNKCFGIGKVSR